LRRQAAVHASAILEPAAAASAVTVTWRAVVASPRAAGPVDEAPADRHETR
jgi:hypothetical protein